MNDLHAIFSRMDKALNTAPHPPIPRKGAALSLHILSPHSPPTLPHKLSRQKNKIVKKHKLKEYFSFNFLCLHKILN
jgi:hypothetical protein